MLFGEIKSLLWDRLNAVNLYCKSTLSEQWNIRKWNGMMEY